MNYVHLSQNLHILCAFKPKLADTLCTFKSKFAHTLCANKPCHIKYQIPQQIVNSKYHSKYQISQQITNTTGNSKHQMPEQIGKSKYLCIRSATPTPKASILDATSPLSTAAVTPVHC